MIAFKWYVTVISTAALLAGCLTNEKKNNPDKNSSDVIKKQSQASPKAPEKEILPDPPMAHYGRVDESPATLGHYPDTPVTSSALTEETGSATFSLLPLKKSFSNAAFDFLLPLNNDKDQLVFSQLGARRYDGRNIINIGIGQRHFFEHWMLGYNTFYDAQVSANHHQRFGLGLELWSQNLKLSANGYWRLSGWKNSYLLKGNEERAANGYDVNLNTYLPFYPQLGGRVKYEQYFGNEVATLNQHERSKNPSALTVGLIYNPVPLITLGWDKSRWNSGKSESKANLMFNYRLNVPLSKQLSPQFNPANINIAGSRFDPVERNNNIVLEYKTKETVDFKLPPDLRGVESERRNIAYGITGKFPLDRIDWDDSALLPQGGKVVAVSKSVYQVQLPAFNPNGVNQFTISAIAYDTAGHASNRSTMTIFTQPAQPLLAEPPIVQETAPSSPVQMESDDEQLIPDSDPIEPEAGLLVNSEPESSAADDIPAETTTDDSASAGEIIEVLSSSPPPPPPPPPGSNEVSANNTINRSVASGSHLPNTSPDKQIRENLHSELFEKLKARARNGSDSGSAADMSSNNSSTSLASDNMQQTSSLPSTQSSLPNSSLNSDFSTSRTSTPDRTLDSSAIITDNTPPQHKEVDQSTHPESNKTQYNQTRVDTHSTLSAVRQSPVLNKVYNDLNETLEKRRSVIQVSDDEKNDSESNWE